MFSILFTVFTSELGSLVFLWFMALVYLGLCFYTAGKTNKLFRESQRSENFQTWANEIINHLENGEKVHLEAKKKRGRGRPRKYEV